jgi:hypothetical protein
MRQVALVRLAIASAAMKVAMVEMDMMAVGLASFVGAWLGYLAGRLKIFKLSVDGMLDSEQWCSGFLQILNGSSVLYIPLAVATREHGRLASLNTVLLHSPAEKRSAVAAHDVGVAHQNGIDWCSRIHATVAVD